MGFKGFQVSFRGSYISGEFRKPSEQHGECINKNPGDFSDEVVRFHYSYSSPGEAVEAAKAAFPAWKKLGIPERSQYLEKFCEAVNRRVEEFAEIIARETGKPMWESHQEVLAMVEEVRTSVADSKKLFSDLAAQKARAEANGAESYRLKPVGVMAVIGSFVSPCEATGAYFASALATGNTVILKPSEKTPFTGQLIAECFDAAGIPKGVFNLVQGEREVGRRLCVSEGVDAVLFTGSYETGTRIKQDTLQQSWKLLVLQMGGKNSSLIWEDADLDGVLRDTLVSAYAFAGQRCTSTSRVIIHEKIVDEFVSKFHQKSKAFSIGNPLTNPFMGPLIDQGSVDRYMKFLGIALREGCEVVMRGKMLDSPALNGNYVTPSICRVKDNSYDAVKKSVYQQNEVMGPNLSVLTTSDLDHAIALTNGTQYGLVSSVYTKDRAVFEKAADELKFGSIHWNRPTILGSPRLPTLGLKKSGNHMPAGSFSPRFCAYPVSSIEGETPIVGNPRQIFPEKI